MSAVGDDYEVGSRLAVGGDATLYAAVHRATGTPCVLKVVEEREDESPTAFQRRRDRLVGEERALRRLAHPHIVRLLDARHDGKEAFLALERLDVIGDALLLGPFLRQVAFGLDCMHAQGIVHNDVSRENVLARSDVAVIIDFGSAAIDGVDGAVDVGKPKFMAPERIANNGSPVDGRSDQFSLAVTAFVWITGQYPFPGEGQRVLQNILRAQPLTLAEAGCPQGAALQWVFDKAFRPNPVDRFCTCSEFAQALSDPSRSGS